jgi:SAM-dependent methyltransferase
MPAHSEANRRLWNTWTPLHLYSSFYDVEAFRNGRLTLTDLEQEELGDVRGKALLHLQCHFGLDTLSWARKGAHVTGVDFSDESLRVARALAAELRLDAEFICADMGGTERVFGEGFDVVYTSFGVIAWLSDLRAWGRLIAKNLKPGGIFYIIEFHPVLGMLDTDGQRFTYSYFAEHEPAAVEEVQSYTGAAHPPQVCYQWTHSLSDVLNALIAAGLRIEYVHEFPFTLHACYPFLVESEPGRYVVRDHPDLLPLTFSIRATRCW